MISKTEFEDFIKYLNEKGVIKKGTALTDEVKYYLEHVYKNGLIGRRVKHIRGEEEGKIQSVKQMFEIKWDDGLISDNFLEEEGGNIEFKSKS